MAIKITLLLGLLTSCSSPELQLYNCNATKNYQTKEFTVMAYSGSNAVSLAQDLYPDNLITCRPGDL